MMLLAFLGGVVVGLVLALSAYIYVLYKCSLTWGSDSDGMGPPNHPEPKPRGRAKK